jgi:hypothetical protein
MISNKLITTGQKVKIIAFSIYSINNIVTGKVLKFYKNNNTGEPYKIKLYTNTSPSVILYFDRSDFLYI